MIRDLHNKLVNKEITSVQLVEEYLVRIEEKDQDYFSYLTLMKEDALERAKKVDEKIARGEEIGILEGIPGAIKDMICIQGVRTTAGSKILDNYIAPYDATVIKRLKEAGAIFLGKTNLDEFATGSSTETGAYGPTKNPYDLKRVAGGSSGGSAVAVAADLAVWSLGTDTGGSIRQPASFCGVVGLKPTYGRVSRYGSISMASSLDQIGTFGKTVEDSAIVLSIISGQDHLDSTSAHSANKKFENYLTGEVKDLKIGIIKEYLDVLGEKEKKLMEKVAAKYEKMGAEICEIEIPALKYALPAYYIIMPAEVSSNLARYDGIKYGLRIDDEKNSGMKAEGLPKKLLETYLDSRRIGLGDEVKRRIMLGTYTLSSGYYDAYYLRAQKVRTLIKNEMEKAFAKVDLILTPTAPTCAFKLGEKTKNPLDMYLADIFTITANITGVPAISVPVEKIKIGDKKLPFGFQLMAKWFDEETLLRAADAYEKN